MQMPYGYYQLLRVLIFCISVYLLIEYKAYAGTGWMWGLIALALIYNPVFRLNLGREVWTAVNIGTIIFYVCHYMKARSMNFVSKK